MFNLNIYGIPEMPSLISHELTILSKSRFLGEAPDGTRYKTAYRCEGETMSISCDSSETIQVIRANYGRFSIAICNKHGYTEWSVNCMSHTTTRILQRR